MKVVRTRRGARLVEGEVTLSEIRSTPGPTHTLFDVLAACTAALAPDAGPRSSPRCALLGFAGGGMVAPLRAMGYDHPLVAVDLDRAGERIFRELSGDRMGEVRFEEMDAADWLRKERTRYDVIVEDLSVLSPVGTIKPYASFDTLPKLVRRRLKDNGVAIVNLLPLPGTTWAALQARVAMPHERSQILHLDEYENRLVLAGDALRPARETSARVRAALRSIESDQARKISVRTR